MYLRFKVGSIPYFKNISNSDRVAVILIYVGSNSSIAELTQGTTPATVATVLTANNLTNTTHLTGSFSYIAAT